MFRRQSDFTLQLWESRALSDASKVLLFLCFPGPFPSLPSQTLQYSHTLLCSGKLTGILTTFVAMPNSRTEAARHSLLPTIVDHLARDEPNSLWGEYPRSSTTLSDGYETLTYKQFANAVNGVAHQIERTIGRRDTREPLAWLAPNDPRCPISLIAAMKVGCNASIMHTFCSRHPVISRLC